MCKRRWIGSHSRKVLKSAIDHKSAILVRARFALRTLQYGRSAATGQVSAACGLALGRLGIGRPAPSIETSIIEGPEELGYMDGKTIVFEHRFAEGRPEKLSVLAAALVQQ